MKNYISYFRALLCSVTLVASLSLFSCKEDDDSWETVILNLDESMKTINFTSLSKVESKTIEGECNTIWEVYFQDETAEWLDFDKMSGRGNVEFTVSTNEKYTVANTTRTAILILEANGLKVVITINQDGIVGSGSVDEDTFTDIDKSGGKVVVEVTSNTTWTAKGTDGVDILLEDNSTASSLEHTASEEDTTKSVTFVVAKNTTDDGTPKEHKVTIESEYFEDITISITQDSYTESTLSLTDAEDAGNTVAGITVYKDCTNLSLDKVFVATDEDSTWSVKNRNSDTWFKVTRTNDDDNFFTIEVTGKNEDEIRYGFIDVTATNGVYAPDNLKTILLTQTTDAIYVELSSDEVEIDADGDVTTVDNITAKSNAAWNTSIEYNGGIEDWLKVSNTSAFVADQENILKFDADPNTSTTPRKATVTIKVNVDNYEKIYVTQAGAAPTITLTGVVAEDTLEIGGAKESTKSFSIFANQDWTATLSGGDSSIFKLSESDGYAGTTTEVTITTKEDNTTTAQEERLTITIEGTGGGEVTAWFTVKQLVKSTADITTTSIDDVSFYDGNTFNIGVSSNTDWKLAFRENDGSTYGAEVIDWMSADKSQYTSAEGTATITVKGNSGEARTGWIVLLDSTDEVMDSISVTQDAHLLSDTAAKLMDLLTALNEGQSGDDIVTPTGWGSTSTTPLSDWYGVALDSDGETVLKLELSNMNFRGTFPDSADEVAALQKAEVIDLSENYLTGKFGNLSKFPAAKEIRINDNNLETLNFQGLYVSYDTLEIFCAQNNSDMKLSSSTGATYSFSNATKLRYLDMSGDAKATGQFPSITALTELEHVDLSGCGFTNTAFADLTTNTKLKYLDISGNAFSGSTPKIYESAMLTYYNVSNNLTTQTQSLTAEALTNLVSGFNTTNGITTTPAVVMSGCTKLKGTVTVAFIAWLKDTLGYSDQDIYDNILKDTQLSVALGSTYDENNVTK